MDMNGHLLSSSKHLMEGSLEKSFSEKYYGLWTKIILWLMQEVGQDFGRVKAIVNFHENCIVELVPVKSRQLIIGLVFSRSTNTDFITSKIFDRFEGNEGDSTGFNNNIFSPKQCLHRKLS